MTVKTLSLLLLGLAAVAIAGQPAAAADAAAGRQKARQCQTCHGIDGIAKIPIAPHIAGESQIYLEPQLRSEEHTSELQSLMRNSYAVFCLTKKQPHHIQQQNKH